MKGPVYRLDSGVNSKESVPYSSRNPSWVVLFIRFAEPAAMQSGSKEKAFDTKEAIIVENDCISVNISNSKSSFGKTASLTMKLGEVWYQNAVSPGDWCFVWMSSDYQDMEEIVESLSRVKGSGTVQGTKERKLNGFNSGLKFMGRVLSLTNSTSIASNGQVTLSQTVNCQAFMEMANSVYYTYISKAIMAASGSLDQKQGSNVLAQSNLREIRNNGMEKALTDIADKFLGLSEKNNGFTTPDELIAILFILIMGVEKEKSLRGSLSIGNIEGSFGDAIGVPKLVSTIMGRPNKTKLWQLYNVILGLQQYDNSIKDKDLEGKTRVGSLFAPRFNESSKQNKKDAVFYFTPVRTKGAVPLQIPPIWDNNNIWSVMSNYLNSIVNEMYTCLRVNQFGDIVPTLIVREKPFSTNLYDYLQGKAAQFEKTKDKQKSSSKQIQALVESSQKYFEAAEEINKKRAKESVKLIDNTKKEEYKERTFYSNIPRWIIPLHKVKTFTINRDESKRINFVQVWGRNSAVEFIQGNSFGAEAFKVSQFLNKNYVADEADIARNGLRADITETLYDIPTATESGTFTQIFARMRADWLFNGHLKLQANMTLSGVTEPICEGDNVEFEGILFHVTAVNHSGNIGPNGAKTFITNLQLENGIVAYSLDEGLRVPIYVSEIPETTPGQAANGVGAPVPGMTDIQNTGERKGRDRTGEKIKKEEGGQ
jgi:hypothetical protein